MAVYTQIDNPELFFQCKIYTGNATDDTAITLDGDENMQPDLVWIKDRTNANHNRIYDSVRGATKMISSSLSSAEATASDGVKSFDSDGFTLGDGSDENGSSANMVAWCWKAGTSFSNDASATSIGSIDSTGSASDTAGVSIVSYTGTGTAGTIKHGLSSAPLITLIKQRSSGGTGSGNWNFVTYQIDGSSDELTLNGTGVKADRSITAPTTSVFSVDTSDERNDSSQTYICYTFAEKQGFSKFGSYKGNGDADGPFIYTGFRPAYLLLKDYTSSNAYNWVILDNKRDPSNGIDRRLQASGNASEYTDVSDLCDFVSNGFKWTTNNANWNGSGTSYVFMAFAEQPFVNSNGVPCNAR